MSKIDITVYSFMYKVLHSSIDSFKLFYGRDRLLDIYTDLDGDAERCQDVVHVETSD